MRTLGGRYQLEQCIGVGGMSEVWRGYDAVLARPVAVKVLSPQLAADGGCEERVRTEARSAAQLAHPNVASVYDFGMAEPDTENPLSERHLPEKAGDQPAPYIVMELVDGATLADHLADGALDWHIAVRVCAEVSAALAAAHSHGIVHRDIKPANIMLTPSGAKVLDFGIAADAGVSDTQPDGTVLGTPAYLAPERLCGRPVTVATDMYALGVVLYQCLTGRLPWKPETGAIQPYLPRHGTLDPLPEIDGMAPEVADLCDRCLSRDPEERPSSLVAALVLAEAVDARVYVPPIELSAAWPPAGTGDRGGPDRRSADRGGPGRGHNGSIDVPTAAAALDMELDVFRGAAPGSAGAARAGQDRFDKLRDPTFDPARGIGSNHG